VTAQVPPSLDRKGLSDARMGKPRLLDTPKMPAQERGKGEKSEGIIAARTAFPPLPVKTRSKRKGGGGRLAALLSPRAWDAKPKEKRNAGHVTSRRRRKKKERTMKSPRPDHSGWKHLAGGGDRNDLFANYEDGPKKKSAVRTRCYRKEKGGEREEDASTNPLISHNVRDKDTRGNGLSAYDSYTTTQPRPSRTINHH